MKTIFGKCDFGTIIMIGIDNETINYLNQSESSGIVPMKL